MRKCKKGSAIYDIWFVCPGKLFELRRHKVSQRIYRLSFLPIHVKKCIDSFSFLNPAILSFDL